MIGYGIPRREVRETEYDGKGNFVECCERIVDDWEEGYLFYLEIAAPFIFSRRWNDFYLNIRARKIQRWFRSFEELPMACPCPE